MVQDELFAGFSERAVARIALCDVVFAAHCRDKLGIYGRWLIALGRRGTEMQQGLRVWPSAAHPLSRCQPPWMGLKPTQDPIHQRVLKVRRWFVAGDPWLAEAKHNRADVLMFEFDRTAAARDQSLQCTIAFCLVEGLTA